MLQDRQFRLVGQDLVKDVGGVTDGGGNRFAPVEAELVTGPGVERYPTPVTELAQD